MSKFNTFTQTYLNSRGFVLNHKFHEHTLSIISSTNQKLMIMAYLSGSVYVMNQTLANHCYLGKLNHQQLDDVIQTFKNL